MASYSAPGFERLIRRFAKIPPFITAPAGLAAFILFDEITRLTVSVPVGIADGGTSQHLYDALFWTVMKGFAKVLKYLVPLILSLSIVLWFVRYFERRADRQRFERVASSPLHSALHDMTWQQFERLVGDAFATLGYAVIHTGRAGPDGGIDLILKRGAEVSLVQCKHWRAARVTVEKVRELYGLMAERGSTHGFVVSAGTYTKDAAQFAYGKSITLVTGEQLHHLIRTGTFPTSAAKSSGFSGFHDGTCPDCGSPMVERTARPAHRGTVSRLHPLSRVQWHPPDKRRPDRIIAASAAT